MTNDRRTEETNTKDINEQQNEGFMTAIQNSIEEEVLEKYYRPLVPRGET